MLKRRRAASSCKCKDAQSHLWSASIEKSVVQESRRDTTDTAQVIVRPPIAWALAVIAGVALNWLMPLPFLPSAVPTRWVGGVVFVLALVLFAWAISTITRAGPNVPTNRPVTTIVESGPYRFTRNTIYFGMMLGLVGLALAFDNLWLLAMLVPFALVIRFGVVAN